MEKDMQLETFFEKEIWPRCQACGDAIHEKGWPIELPNHKDKLLVTIEVYKKESTLRENKQLQSTLTVNGQDYTEFTPYITCVTDHIQLRCKMVGPLGDRDHPYNDTTIYSMEALESCLKIFCKTFGVLLPEDFVTNSP